MSTTPESIISFVNKALAAKRGQCPIPVIRYEPANETHQAYIEVGLQYSFDDEGGNVDTSVQYFRTFLDSDEAVEYGNTLGQNVYDLWNRK